MRTSQTRWSLQTSVSLFFFASWESISTISFWQPIPTIPPSWTLNSVHYILALLSELPLVVLSCVDCTLLSSLGRAREKVYIQSINTKISCIEPVVYFQDCLLLLVSYFEYIFLYLEAANIESIPAAVLRHKTARNTTAGTRSISTNLKCRMIATTP